MKKLLFVLGLCMSLAMLTLTSCNKDSDTEGSIIGSWEPTEVVDNIEGEDTVYDPYNYGIPTEWTFRNDGTFTWAYSRSDENNISGKWNINGSTLNLKFTIDYGDGDIYNANLNYAIKSMASDSMVLSPDMQDGTTVTITFKKL